MVYVINYWFNNRWFQYIYHYRLQYILCCIGCNLSGNYHISVEDQAFGLTCNICVKNLYRFSGQEHRYCVRFELQQIVVIVIIYGNNGNCCNIGNILR